MAALTLAVLGGAGLAWWQRPRPVRPRSLHAAHAPRVEAITHDAGRIATPTPTQPAPPRVSLGRGRRVTVVSSRVCRALASDDGSGHFLARADLLVPPGVWPGDDAMAVVSRHPAEALGPAEAPDDLVDLATMREETVGRCVPPERQCMRREAARALQSMMAVMREEGVTAAIHSAFRDHPTQCAVFHRWAVEVGQGFCRATIGSALPGHSQHQLGTAVDLFTEAWIAAGPALRAGFGCSPGGRWIAAHAGDFGFVLPYPAPRRADGDEDPCAVSTEVDGRTGYEYEPWHLRWVGRPMVLAWLDTRRQGEVFDSWLRRMRGGDDDAGLPVCDGCQCGFCATFAAPGEESPCGARALRLDVEGNAHSAVDAPVIERARFARGRWTVTVRVPEGTVTQTPVVNGRFAELPYYEALGGAWRVVFREGAVMRGAVALVGGNAPGWVNGASRRLPATSGSVTLDVDVGDAGEGWQATVERGR